jgi:hypothetical protein
MGAPGNDERKLESGGAAPAPPTRNIHPAFYIAYVIMILTLRECELLMDALGYGLL